MAISLGILTQHFQVQTHIYPIVSPLYHIPLGLRPDGSKKFSVSKHPAVVGSFQVVQFPYLGVGQYLYNTFLVGWTSIYQLFWGLKMGYTPNEIAILSRDNDQQKPLGLAVHNIFRQSHLLNWWFQSTNSLRLLQPTMPETCSGGWFGTFCCSIYWECHNPNWRTHIFQRGRSTTNPCSWKRWGFNCNWQHMWMVGLTLIPIGNHVITT